MAYLNETGLEQVFKEVKSRIEKAKSEASSAGTTAASNVQKNLDDHTKIDNKDNISGAHGYNKNDLNVGFSYKTDTKATTFTAIDGYSNSVSTTVPAASSSNPGLMSIDDKNKLDGIAANANNYSLPTAAKSTLGGIKVGYTTSGNNRAVQVDTNGNAYVAQTDTTYSNATTTAAGLLSATDKKLIDTLPDGGYSTGNSTVQMTATKAASQVTVTTSYSDGFGSNKSGNVIIDEATASQAGVMSATDKQQLTKLYTTNNLQALTVNSSGLISSANLPSYVDDVIEGYIGYYNTGTTSSSYYILLSKEPANSSSVTSAELANAISGEAGKIYVDIATNKTYRWVAPTDTSVNAYGNMVEISASLALGNTSSTAYAGDKGAALESRMTAVENKASANATSISNIGSAITTDAVKASAKSVFGD